MATVQEVIAEEWRERATELADWAMARLVNRRDVWGQYATPTPTERRANNRTYKAMTLPAVDQRSVTEKRVTLDKLTRHFASRRHRKPQLIGLHAKSPTSTSRWLGIDVDNHSADAHSGDDLARRNLVATVNWCQQLRRDGYDPLLFDSNGAGGFHLWVLFEESAPTSDVHAFALAITADWEAQQLERQPEVFPKRERADSLGAWFRLPGLHHTRNHHARLWSDDGAGDDPWLSGHAAIDAMLACLPGPAPLGSDSAAAKSARSESDSSAERRARAVVAGSRNATQVAADRDARPGDVPVPATARKFARRGRPRVCVDLDGVLAHHSGNDTIGPPIDGAVEFSRALQRRADIVVFTARFSTRKGKARSPAVVERLERRLEAWLERNGFAWDTINTAVAKPIASAYVDDRAVPCRPIEEGLLAFDHALAQTLLLCQDEVS